MPMIEVSEEELEHRRQGEVLDRLHEAFVRGDREEQRRVEAELAPSATVLMRAKRVMGAAWLRRQAYDMRRAEEVYGPTWLDDD